MTPRAGRTPSRQRPDSLVRVPQRRVRGPGAPARQPVLEPGDARGDRVAVGGQPAPVVGDDAIEERPPAADREPLLVAGDHQIVVDHDPEQLATELVVGASAGVHGGEDRGVLVEDLEMPGADGGGDPIGGTLPVVVADLVQDLDGLGGHEQRVTVGAVLVPAAAEGQPGAVEQLPADNLGPGRLGEPQQLRTLGQPHRRGQAADDVGRALGDYAAIGVRLRMIDDEHVRPVVTQLLRHLRDGARGEPIVGVDEPHVLAARLRQAGVAGRSEAAVDRQVQHPHAWVTARAIVEDRPASVRRGVVDGDDLKVGRRVGEDGVEAFVEVRRDAEHGNHHRQRRRLLGTHRRRRFPISGVHHQHRYVNRGRTLAVASTLYASARQRFACSRCSGVGVVRGNPV
ncbi:hypothetical protein GCM10010201_31780 [Pilimelia columellifera subsp. columellifera]|uniref:Uncharacterized protein n=1 Tax=Pilimelia columellifera subsp. columellifera TaxID=706583 RepID=A0ABN3NRH6_9ACTN